MDIKQKMESKWEEITATKNERESLFDNFEANKDHIADLHFEVEIKQLQYMFLKREQLAELKKTAFDPDSVTKIEKVNETCLDITQKRLIEYGYGERSDKKGSFNIALESFCTRKCRIVPGYHVYIRGDL